MSFDTTLLLAFVQGATEFLPISSSGHLILMEKFNISNQDLLMDISLHLGTLFAVVAFFRKEIFRLIVGFWHKGAEQKLGFQLILATVPALVVGFFLNDIIETTFRSPRLIAYTSIFYGVLLWAADYFSPRKKTVSDLTYKDALIVGCAQALALIPGTSRSGITMTAARFLGVNRVDSARFSMLMSIPVIALGAAYMIFKGAQDGTLTNEMIEQVLVGIASAGVFGLLAVWFLMRWLKTASFVLFAVYRITLGFFLLWFFW